MLVPNASFKVCTSSTFNNMREWLLMQRIKTKPLSPLHNPLHLHGQPGKFLIKRTLKTSTAIMRPTQNASSMGDTRRYFLHRTCPEWPERWPKVCFAQGSEVICNSLAGRAMLLIQDVVAAGMAFLY